MSCVFLPCAQLLDVIREPAECQGKCWAMVWRRPQAREEEETAQYELWQWQTQTSGRTFNECDRGPSCQTCQTPVKLYYLVVGNTGQPGAAPAWLWTNAFQPDSEDKGSRLGVRGKNNSSQLWGELAVNLKVSSGDSCQYKPTFGWRIISYDQRLIYSERLTFSHLSPTAGRLQR